MTTQPDAPCPRCGTTQPPTLTQGKGPHAIRASCGHCGKFLRWVSVLAPSERMARKMQARLETMQKHLPSAAQLDYLQALGDTLGAPQSMG